MVVSEPLPADGMELSATKINEFWLLIVVEESSVMNFLLVMEGTWIHI